MTQFENISLILAFVAILLGYAAYHQSKKNNILQKKIAQLQGIYDKPQLDILLYDKPLVTEYIYAFPFKEKGAFIVPLKLTLANNGNFRAKNIEFYINSSNELIPHEIMKLKTSNNSFTENQFKILSKTENKTTCGIQIEHLEQKNGMNMEFHLPIKSSTVEIRGNTVVTTPDNVQSKIEYTYSYSYNINLWAHSENHSPISKELGISVFDTSSKTLREYFREKALENEKQHIAEIKKLSKLQKIKYYLNPNHKLKPQLFNICYITSNEFVDHESLPKLNNVKSLEIGFGAYSTDGFIFINSLKLNGYQWQQKT